ncbi:MAG: hypothetical protein GY820_43835 [Gammaproteobacteria bacterium]|nr:hypothetical protein [Gammaproteobacteria bacterium]
MNIVKSWRMILLVLCISVLSACSQLPDEKNIEKLFTEQKLSDGLGDLFGIYGFRKTNGFQQSDNIYIVDVEYHLEFKKSLTDVITEISKDPVGPQYGVLGSKFIALTMKANFGNFSAGDRIHKAEKITLRRTEQGWQLVPD